MKRKIKSALVLLTAITLGIISSCTSTDDGISGNDSTKGSLKILLTDAPFPSDLVAQVNVVIDEVSINKVNDDSSEDDDSGWSVLSSEESSFNLLDLQNGAVAVLADFEEFPIGTYSEIRLHIVSAEVVLTEDAGGETYDLKIPSGTSSGLKVKIDGNLEVRGGNAAALIVDFDVAQSFLVQGNPTKNGKEITGFKFKPVIRATAEDISGTVEGYVSVQQLSDGVVSEVPGVGIQVTVTDGTNTYIAISSDNGYYAIIGVLPGEYTVSATADGYKDFSTNTNVETNMVATANVLLELPLGTVTGTVTNVSTAALIQAATVEILNGESTVIATATTNENGVYEAENIPVGTYSVKFTATGYDVLTVADAVVSDATTTTVDAALTATVVSE